MVMKMKSKKQIEEKLAIVNNELKEAYEAYEAVEDICFIQGKRCMLEWVLQNETKN